MFLRNPQWGVHAHATFKFLADMESEKQHHWLRGLRPLLWWVLYVLFLYAYHTHQQLSEKTRLSFSASLERRVVDVEASTTLDGSPFKSGDRVSIGRHTLVISYPKAESFSTNLFIWYGEHNLGNLVLTRGKGLLAIKANPPAAFIDICGPEFSLKLTNSTGLTTNVPTDRYMVEAQYSHWQQAGEVTVFPNMPGTWNFAPRLGVLQMICSRSGASFQLQRADGRLVEAGEFPSVITELPQGRYKLIAQHHGHQRERVVEVTASATNNVQVEFVYGAAVFETAPAGATVRSDNGEVGVTPLSLSELEPGLWTFMLRREGYEPVLAKLEIVGNQTNTFRTNLVSTTYVGAVNAARRYLALADYDRALAATADALQVKPNDPDAIALQKEALGKRNLRQAEAFGKQGDYIAGIKELELALQALPENEEAKQLLADFKKREPEQIDRKSVERLEQPKKLFESILAKTPDADLFDSHELKTSKSVKEVEAAIVNALRNVRPIFQVTRDTSPQPETFEIVANQELITILATSAGGRKCVIVGGQTRDDETQILFKVLEFKSEAVNKFSIGAWIGAPAAVTYVLIHPSRFPQMNDKLKAQLQEGVSNVTARIQGAIGQTTQEK